MKYLSSILITCFCLSISAQGEYPRNSFVVHLDPGIGSLTWNFPVATSGDIHTRKPFFNFSVGLNYEHAFNDKNSIITGIDFHSIGDISKVDHGEIPHNGDPTSIRYSESPGHLYQIGVPVVYGIGKSFNKFSIKGLIGLINSFAVAEAKSNSFTNYNGETTKYDWKVYPPPGFTYNLDAKLGVNIQFFISEQISIGLEPYTRIGIYTPSNFKPFFNHWNFLCALNFKYTFKPKN